METESVPHDRNLELALLALLLADNAKIDSVDRLEGDHFFDLANREVFLAMRDLLAEGRRVSLVTLGGLMGSDPLGGKAAALDSLKQFSFNGQAPHAHDVANSLIGLFTARQMQAIGQRLADSVWNYRTKRADIIEATMRELDALLASERPQKRTSWDLESGMNDMLRGLDADISDKFMTTGLKSLDALIGGMRRGDLIYLGGRPNMGKTTIAVSIIINVAKAGHGVLFHSLEMDKDAVLMRVASEAAYTQQRQLPYADAIRGRFTPQQKEDFVRAALSRAGLPVLIDERSGLSAMQVAMEVRKARVHFERQGRRLGLLVIDHLTKIRPSKHYRGNKTNEVGEISNALAHLAKSENVAVLCLAQLNRAVEGRTENKRPQLSDLRESGEIEQDADTVLFAYRDAYYLARERHEEGSPEEKVRQAEFKRMEHVLEILVGKARNGPDGRVELFCDMASNVVADLDRRGSMRVDFAETGQRYAGELGWKVFPLAQGSKVPAIKGGAGFKDATLDADQIRAWARAYPNANIGIWCGEASDIVIVDIDPRNGGDVSLRVRGAKGCAFPPLPRSRTGNDGWHLVLQWAQGIGDSKGKLGSGIEVKSGGGYIVAPPSWTKPSKDGPGGLYRWEVSPFDVPPPRAPTWLTALLPPPLQPARSQNTLDARSGNLSGALRFAATSPDGSRNNSLFWSACRAGEMIARRLISEESAMRQLTEAARAVGLTGPHEEPKALRTIISGLKTGQQQRGAR